MPIPFVFAPFVSAPFVYSVLSVAGYFGRFLEDRRDSAMLMPLHKLYAALNENRRFLKSSLKSHNWVQKHAGKGPIAHDVTRILWPFPGI